VVPRAEKAIESGDPKEAIGFVLRTIEEELQRRFNQVNAKKKYDENDVVAGREYVHAFINFVVYSHHLYAMVKGDGTNDEEKGGHGH
jgi:hypothetical protein